MQGSRLIILKKEDYNTHPTRTQVNVLREGGGETTTIF